MKERIVLPQDLAFAPFFIFGLVFLALIIGYMIDAALTERGLWSTHVSPPTLSTSTLRTEPQCVKRLLIKRVSDGHLVTAADVSHAKAVCEQAIALTLAK